MAKFAAMGRSIAVLMVMAMAVAGASAHKDPKHKTHNVTFYAHEAINTGDDATAVIVAGPGGNTSYLQFGALVVVDDIITETADPNSAPLGKLQGLYVLDGSTKYRAQVTVIIDQPGDLVETTYEVSNPSMSYTQLLSPLDRSLQLPYELRCRHLGENCLFLMCLHTTTFHLSSTKGGGGQPDRESFSLLDRGESFIPTQSLEFSQTRSSCDALGEVPEQQLSLSNHWISILLIDGIDDLVFHNEKKRSCREAFRGIH